jgi:hypothetical protein
MIICYEKVILQNIIKIKEVNKMNTEEQLYSPLNNTSTRKVWDIKELKTDSDNIEKILKNIRDEYIKDFRDI